MGVRRMSAVAIAVAGLAATATTAAASVSPSGSYTGHVSGGIGKVVVTFAHGKFKSFSAPSPRVNNANCTQTTSLSSSGPAGAGWQKPKIVVDTLSKNGSFGLRLSWKPVNPATSSGAAAFLSGKFSGTSLKATVQIDWTYAGSGGYYYDCNTGSHSGTLKK